ncbi:uncharacterized protein LOC126802598 [Argentina anserina]|uniref:uncharacterized protein LOC126802598 n=1 Tax=Argentina anserina TaxID=57926 RepID=UPI00217642C5|nr:uncharacterized protein LOC126802598 [Potentilla anserina]
MARTAILHLLRSHSKRLPTSNFLSGYQPCKSGAWARGVNAKPSFNSGVGINAFQQRWASQAAAKEDDGKISIGPRKVEVGKDEKDSGIVYYGPISSTIQRVKLLSLSTCCLSVSLGPVITFMTLPDMNVILKGAMTSSVMFLSASTTAALHWFATPYIHKLKWKPGSDSFEVEMLSWLATYTPRTIKFADIRPPETQRPFVTFKANEKFYFIDADHCQNKALLAKLEPQKAPTRESAFKNL